MKIAIAGGHGKIGRRLIRLLVDSGEEVCSLDRNPAHAAEIEGFGAEPQTCDLEQASTEEVARAIAGVDAVVFAAGAGAGSGAERKETMDYGGAVKLIEAARAQGIRRYVMVSSIGAHDPAGGPEQMRAYLEAKAEADAALEDSGLDFTIVRPGSLRDDPGTGRVELVTELGRTGPVPRDDVAAVLAEVLIADNTVGKTFELFAGETPIAEAVRPL
ncbi:MAG: SDR family oxidoreductase [Solirubrobacterales bacterium]